MASEMTVDPKRTASSVSAHQRQNEMLHGQLTTGVLYYAPDPSLVLLALAIKTCLSQHVQCRKTLDVGSRECRVQLCKDSYTIIVERIKRRGDLD